MKKILIVNCGSSSIKYEVYDMPERASLGKGIIERIGEQTGKIRQESPGGVLEESCHIADHRSAMQLLKKAMLDPTRGILGRLDEIAAIGHRVVHGGEYYAESVKITDEVISKIEECSELAPLHNPPNLTGIREVMALLPGCVNVAVFDTAFHQTLPPAAYLYGIPRELYDKYKIRRYGFHGTSHRYVSAEALRMLKRSAENTNVITCHLGNGASITAISHGKSIDTSMGFTPLEGLIMGTRSGDIDPAVLLFLLERGYNAKDLNDMLNKKSGLLGLSGISNDLRDIKKAAEAGDTRAQETLEVYAHRVRKYIGAYAANIVKVDVLVFTGGIGQYSLKMRERICHRLENIGIMMDYKKNIEVGSTPGVISHDYSPTTIMVVPTNEELQIAIDTAQIVFG
jgi:acetate kinase